MLSTLDYEWEHRYPGETHMTRSWPCYAGICVGGTHLIITTIGMCSGEHISWGNTYHCNTSQQSGAACTRPICSACHAYTCTIIMHTCIDMHTHARTYTHTVTCTHACTHTHTHTHGHTREHTPAHTHTRHVRTQRHAQTHTHVRIVTQLEPGTTVFLLK